MKDAIGGVGEDDDLVPGLFAELASPALPAHWLPGRVFLLPLQSIRRRRGKHQQGEDYVHAHSPLRFLRWMVQVLLLPGFLDTAVLNETTAIVVIKHLQGFLHRGVG
jgi:hypothetical protein